MTTPRVLALAHTGVSTATHLSEREMKRVWHGAVNLILAQDPGLRARMRRSQEPVLTVQDGYYVAVIHAPDQTALINRRGQPLSPNRRDPQRALFDEQAHVGEGLARAAIAAAEALPEVRRIITQEADPISALESLGLDADGRKILAKAVVSGAPAVELEMEATTARIRVDPGEPTRRTVLLDLRHRVQARVTKRVRGGSMFDIRLLAESTIHSPLPRVGDLRLRVPPSLEDVTPFLMLACITRQPVTLIVMARQSIVSGRVHEVFLCGVLNWRRDFAAMAPLFPEPPILRADEVAQEIATWGMNLAINEVPMPAPSSLRGAVETGEDMGGSAKEALR